MPTWLFWALAEAQERERIKERLDVYQANGASANGFKPESGAALVDGWQKILSQPIRPITGRKSTKAKVKKRAPNESKMTRAERIALWSGRS